MDLRGGREVRLVRRPGNPSLASIEPVGLMLSRLDGDDTQGHSEGRDDTVKCLRLESVDRYPSSSTTQGSAGDSRDHPGMHRHPRKVGDGCSMMPTFQFSGCGLPHGFSCWK